MKKTSRPKIQRGVAELYEKNGWHTDPTLLLLAMTEELGDLLNLIFAFCNTQGLNFEECVKNTIKKRSKQG